MNERNRKYVAADMTAVLENERFDFYRSLALLLTNHMTANDWGHVYRKMPEESQMHFNAALVSYLEEKYPSGSRIGW